jgi:hypothetical protein
MWQFENLKMEEARWWVTIFKLPHFQIFKLKPVFLI